MSDNFEIGKSKYGNSKNFGEGKTWFYLKDNTDNVYRVLPAMFGLARTGQYAKWYAIHRGLRGTNNRQYPFLCIEEADRKTNTITRQCPICNKVSELEGKLELAKKSGTVTSEQVKEFNLSQIWPLSQERKYYLNVVNLEGKIGLLAIGSKMFKSLEATCIKWEGQGYDITGTQGVYVNFRVAKAYKGDKEAVHTADVYMQSSPDGSFRPLTHEITPDFVNQLKNDASDLTALFKEIPVEAMALLADAPSIERSKLIDKIFAVPDKKETATGIMNAHVPGTDATMVGRAEIENGQVAVKMPQMPVQPAVVVPPASANPFGALNNVSQTPFVQTSVAAPIPNTVKNSPPQVNTTQVAQKTSQALSDDEFYNIIGKR